MTIVTFNRKELEKHIGKITPEVEHAISMFGTPVEDIHARDVSLEVFPNRPDLLSLQGFVRSFRMFLGKKPGLKEHTVVSPKKEYAVVVDRSVARVRPYTECMIVSGLTIDETRLKDIIAVQEKLHFGFGRDRKKIAIGIYPLESITLPIRYEARKPEDIVFQPLEASKDMSAKEILKHHPAGIAYNHLLEGCERYPVFVDSKGEILSMPPIINSHRTGKVTEKTKAVFVECSGFNSVYLRHVITMLAYMFADMGGTIHGMYIHGKKKHVSPDLSPFTMKLSRDDVEKTLGITVSEKALSEYLARMGIGYHKGIARIPRYRTDILHPIDLIEDVAIAYGYDRFEPEIPQIATIGSEHHSHIIQRVLSEVLIGLGFLEVSTYHLSTKEHQFKQMGIREYKPQMIMVEDSKTEHTVLRASIRAQLIGVLRENSDAAYPQKLFEIGTVFAHDAESETGVKESERVGIAICDERAGFTEIKQVLEYMCKAFRLVYTLKETEHPSFISGRCGTIVINGKDVGVIGEISPTVLKNNKIKMPVGLLEMDMDVFGTYPK